MGTTPRVFLIVGVALILALGGCGYRGCTEYGWTARASTCTAACRCAPNDATHPHEGEPVPK